MEDLFVFKVNQDRNEYIAIANLLQSSVSTENILSKQLESISEKASGLCAVTVFVRYKATSMS